MAQRGPTSLSPTYTKARISYSVCDRGNKQQAWGGGGEAPLISGLAGLRGSLPCVKGDGHFGGKFWHIVTKFVTVKYLGSCLQNQFGKGQVLSKKYLACGWMKPSVDNRGCWVNLKQS